MLRSIRVLPFVLAMTATGVAAPATLTIKERSQSKTAPPSNPTIAAARTSSTTIRVTVRGSGTLCNGQWSLRGDVIHGEMPVEPAAPALPSCTIVFELSPWKASTIGVEIGTAAVQLVPVR